MRDTSDCPVRLAKRVFTPLAPAIGMATPWSEPPSIPFFMHPISNMKLDVLPHCIDDENPKKFENITAGEFLEERLRDLGLRK